MANFLSSDDPFPIIPGSESLFVEPSLALPSTSSTTEPTTTSSSSTTTASALTASTAAERAAITAAKRAAVKSSRCKSPVEESSAPRKRARKSPVEQPQPHPQPAPQPPSLIWEGEVNATNLAHKLNSSDPNDIVIGLNKLLQVTADHDLNYALGRDGQLVIDQLVRLFDDTIGWKHANKEFDRRATPVVRNHFDDDDDDDGDNYDLSDLIPSAKTWECRASPSIVGMNDLDDFSWVTFCATKFAPSLLNTAMTPSHIMPSNILSDADGPNTSNHVITIKHHMKRLEVIIMIIRNLSYVQGNMRYLTHSVGIIRILTGSLYFRNFRTGRAERGPKSDRDDSSTFGNNNNNSNNSNNNQNNHNSSTTLNELYGNSANNICVHAIHAIINLIPSIDFSGTKLFADLHLLDNQLKAATTTTSITPPQTTTATTTTATQSRNQTKTNKAATDTLIDIQTLINPQKGTYGQIQDLGLFGAIFIAKNFSVRDESFAKVPTHPMIYPTVKRYMRAYWTIFPPLVSLIGVRTSRAVVISALDLMIVMIDNDTTKGMVGSGILNKGNGNDESSSLFSCISDEILYQLVRLLWKNRLGPDSLEYIDPVINMVTRVSSMKLLGTYDSTVDYELRDRAIEFLVKLTAMSPELKQRVGRKIQCTPTDMYGMNETTATDSSNTKLYDAIIPALTTKVGRDQTPLFAAKLLHNLCSVKENHAGILYLRRKMRRTVMTTAIVNEQIYDILFDEVLNIE